MTLMLKAADIRLTDRVMHGAFCSECYGNRVVDDLTRDDKGGVCSRCDGSGTVYRVVRRGPYRSESVGEANHPNRAAEERAER